MDRERAASPSMPSHHLRPRFHGSLVSGPRGSPLRKRARRGREPRVIPHHPRARLPDADGRGKGGEIPRRHHGALPRARGREAPRRELATSGRLWCQAQAARDQSSSPSHGKARGRGTEGGFQRDGPLHCTRKPGRKIPGAKAPGRSLLLLHETSREGHTGRGLRAPRSFALWHSVGHAPQILVGRASLEGRGTRRWESRGEITRVTTQRHAFLVSANEAG